MESKNPAWYESWFNQQYLRLYSHRNDEQALSQVKAIVQKLALTKNSKIMDVGCGSGRHLGAFRGLGFSPFGLDLSWDLLTEASRENSNLIRGNMLFPPVLPNSLDFMGFFFSSFGYFDREEDDLKALKGWSSCLKKQGFLFLDLANLEYVVENLVPEQEDPFEGGMVRQTRHMEKDVVVKNIHFVIGEKTSQYQERLRLYSLSKMEQILSGLGYNILDVWGDEKATSYHAKLSSRMSIIATLI